LVFTQQPIADVATTTAAGIDLAQQPIVKIVDKFLNPCDAAAVPSATKLIFGGSTITWGSASTEAARTVAASSTPTFATPSLTISNAATTAETLVITAETIDLPNKQLSASSQPFGVTAGGRAFPAKLTNVIPVLDTKGTTTKGVILVFDKPVRKTVPVTANVTLAVETPTASAAVWSKTSFGVELTTGLSSSTPTAAFNAAAGKSQWYVEISPPSPGLKTGKNLLVLADVAGADFEAHTGFAFDVKAPEGTPISGTITVTIIAPDDGELLVGTASVAALSPSVASQTPAITWVGGHNNTVYDATGSSVGTFTITPAGGYTFVGSTNVTVVIAGGTDITGPDNSGKVSVKFTW